MGKLIIPIKKDKNHSPIAVVVTTAFFTARCEFCAHVLLAMRRLLMLAHFFYIYDVLALITKS